MKIYINKGVIFVALFMEKKTLETPKYSTTRKCLNNLCFIDWNGVCTLKGWNKWIFIAV